MFTEKTVFILGAGASQPYGFPTGEELLNLIRSGISGDDSLLRGENSFSDFANGKQKEALKKLKGSLGTVEGSIDGWLAKDDNEDCREVGRWLIARAIALRENRSVLHRNESGWYGDLWQELSGSARNIGEVARNNVAFITFNYDRSLEQTLFEKAKDLWSKAALRSWTEAVEGLHIIHVHGQIGWLSWQSDKTDREEDVHEYGGKCEPGWVPVCSRGIVLPMDASGVDGRYQKAKQHLSEAKVIHFMGFGFNEDNASRLAANVSLQPDVRLSATVRGLQSRCVKQLESSSNWFGRVFSVRDLHVRRYWSEVAVG